VKLLKFSSINLGCFRVSSQCPYLKYPKNKLAHYEADPAAAPVKAQTIEMIIKNIDHFEAINDNTFSNYLASSQ